MYEPGPAVVDAVRNLHRVVNNAGATMRIVTAENDVTIGQPVVPDGVSGHASTDPRQPVFPPTEAELLLLGEKIGLPETEVRKFLTYYESNGWRVGRNPMKSVPHALSHWKLRWQEHSRAHRSDFERGF